MKKGFGKFIAASAVIFLSASFCHAVTDLSWLGAGVTGIQPAGITVKHWFNDKEGGIRFVNVSAGVRDDNFQLLLDYAWEYGRNFTGLFVGCALVAENGGFGAGINVGAESLRFLDIARLNVSLDAGPYIMSRQGRYDVVFTVRIALRYWDKTR